MISIKGFLQRLRFLLLILLFISGCATETTVVVPQITVIPPTPEEILRAKEIWQKVEERNRTVEKSTEWINDSYSGIKIKLLTNIPIERYVNYKKFLDNGSVYIINHPAFYTFFHHKRIDRKDNSMTKNIMDILLEGDNTSGEGSSEKDSAPRYSKKIKKTIEEFERIGRNFLEFESTAQKLIILMLPGDYKRFSNYRYKDRADEFLRYINDVTNMSESVLYVESKKANSGQLVEEDLNTLIEFLQKIGATSILLGGEYIGRCQEDFYKQLREVIGSTMTVEVVPELSPPSPEDMTTHIKDLLDLDNRLDIQAAAFNILNNRYERLDIIPKLRNLKSPLVYEKPKEAR